MENLRPFPDRQKYPSLEEDRLKDHSSELISLRKEYFQVFLGPPFDIFSLAEDIGENIRNDLPLWISKTRSRLTRLFGGYEFSRKKTYTVLGSARDMYLHPTASVLHGNVIDTRNGEVILDEGVEVAPFSYIQGPLYAAPRAKLDNLHISNSIVGSETRLGGEIEGALIGDFTNKHHEGFLGHSIIGKWVNLGALTTSSDLKNNYGNIRITIPRDFYPNAQNMLQMDTNRIKFGAIIGDFVKTAIATMLNTGTVLDAGTSVFGSSPPKYLPPFCWGSKPERSYELQRFLRDSSKVASRREQKIPKQVEELITTLHQNIQRTIQSKSISD